MWFKAKGNRFHLVLRWCWWTLKIVLCCWSEICTFKCLWNYEYECFTFILNNLRKTSWFCSSNKWLQLWFSWCHNDEEKVGDRTALDNGKRRRDGKHWISWNEIKCEILFSWSFLTTYVEWSNYTIPLYTHILWLQCWLRC